MDRFLIFLLICLAILDLFKACTFSYTATNPTGLGTAPTPPITYIQLLTESDCSPSDPFTLTLTRQWEVDGFLPYDKATVTLDEQTGIIAAVFTFSNFASWALTPGADISVTDYWTSGTAFSIQTVYTLTVEDPGLSTDAATIVTTTASATVTATVSPSLDSASSSVSFSITSANVSSAASSSGLPSSVQSSNSSSAPTAPTATSSSNKGLSIGLSVGLVSFFLISAGTASFIILRCRGRRTRSIAELVAERFELGVDIGKPSHNTNTEAPANQRDSANLSKEY